MSWTVILPVKHPIAAKSRLSTVLSLHERKALVRYLLKIALDALSDTPEIEAVWFVSPSSPQSWELSAYDLHWHEAPGMDLNHDIQSAYQALRGKKVLVLLPDLPLLKSQDVSALLKLADQEGCVLAPDHTGTGTNAIAISDGRSFDFAFGEDSLKAHRKRAGLKYRALMLPGIAYDCDHPEDLTRLGSLCPTAT